MNKKIYTILALVFFALATIGLQAQTANLSSPSKKTPNNSEKTFFEIQQEFNDYWAGKNVVNGYYEENGVQKKAPGWKQFKRWEWYWSNRVNPTTGEFPNVGSSDFAPDKDKRNGGSKSTTGNWTNLGPSTSSGGYSGIGRLNCIGFRPGDNLTLYVGSPSGGIWKSTNYGGAWTAKGDFNAVIGVSDIIVIAGATTDQDIVYIATGDRDGGSGWSLGGGQSRDNNSIGVLKSTDGGTTWATTGLTFTASQKRTVNRILMDPNDNSILYAAASNGLYKTNNAGVSWTQLTTGEFVDMEFKPGVSSTIYASTRYGEIYVSTNSGVGWTNILSNNAAGGRRIELAVSPDEPTWLYAVEGEEDGSLYAVYKSTNSGATINSIYNSSNLLGYYCDGSDSRGQAGYDLAIAVDPTDATRLFIGGVNTFVSTDGGVSWTASNMWTSSTTYNPCGAPVIHADKHFLAFQEGSTTLWECNDGGLYYHNKATGLYYHKSNGLEISQLYRIGVSQTSSTTMIGGFQDVGTKSYASGTWTDRLGGDGMDCMIDYTNSSVQYGEIYFGDLYRTTNGWTSKTSINTGLTGDAWWVMPISMHPTTPNTIYAGMQDVFKSTNQGTNWTKISNFGLSGTIRELAVAPSNPNYIYASFDNVIYKTTNDGTTWSNITGTLPTGTSLITYIAVKNDDPNTVWVTLGQYNSDGIYQTTNGGTSWTNISTGLPTIPVMCVTQNKLNTAETELYVGTDVGVYVKVGTSPWTLFSNGLPNVLVTELQIYYNTTTPSLSRLRAGTFGRSIWESELYSPDNLPPVTDFSADITSPAIGETVTFSDLSTNIPTSWAWTFTPSTVTYVGGTNSTSQNPQVQFDAAGDYSVQLTATNTYGSDIENKIDYISVLPYCLASGTITDEWISGVQLGTINNTVTPGDHYHDYTSLSTDLETGQDYDITVTNGKSYTDDDLGVWIDWNQDNDFDDVDENIVCEINGGADGTFNFTVPGTAILGNTVMRVRIKYNGSDCGDPCGTTTYGEVEDYRINVVAPTTPTITTSVTSLTAFANTQVGSSSASQNFTASGTDLTGDITVTAPAEFQVSLAAGSGYGNSVTLTPVGGTVANTIIYARFSPTSTGNKAGNIVLSSAGATDKNVAVSGEGVVAIITTSVATLPAFTNTQVGSTSTSQNFTASGTDLTGDITVTAPAEFQVSLAAGSGYGNSVTLTPVGGTVANTNIYARFSPTSTGNKAGNIVLSSAGATDKNVAVSGEGIAATVAGLWTGATSTVWDLAANWDDNNVPVLTTDVHIPTGLTNYPMVGSTSQANCNNLTIDAGASLTLSSDATGTSSLIIDGTLTNNGTITSERYMPGANQAWHMVGSPVNNLAIGTSDFNPGATDDFYAWDEPTPGTWVNFKNQDGSQGNPSFPVANGGNNFHAGKGYLVAYDATNPTKTFVGNLTTSDVSFTLSYNAVKADWTYSSGWNLLSNPYPSGIDWNIANRTNFQDNFAYVYNPNKPGGEDYTTVNGSNPDAYIAPHQGFLVVADPGANGQVFNFTTTMKSHGGNYLKATDDNLLNLRLTSGNFYNETSLLLDAQSSFQRDRRDALKLFSFNPEIPQLYSFSSDQAQLSVNSIPYVDGATTVNLGFLAAHQDTYEISLQTQTGNMNHLIYLEDKLTTQMHNLSTHSYTFGSDAGQINDRFTLHFGVTGINPHETPSLNAYCVNATLYITGENGPANLEIFALSGKRIASEKVILNGLFSKKVDLSTGMYLVRVTNNNMVKTAKIIIR